VRLLNVDLPSQIPAGEVKIDPTRNVFPNDLGAGCGMEGALVDMKESLAIAGLRPEPQQRSEGQPVHHAEAAMIAGLKGQGVDVIAPSRWISLLIQRRLRHNSAITIVSLSLVRINCHFLDRS
jgi:hypothetical protein